MNNNFFYVCLLPLLNKKYSFYFKKHLWTYLIADLSEFGMELAVVLTKVIDAILVPRREVLSSFCSALFDGQSMPYSCTVGASGSTVMFEQRPLYVGGAITGGREKLHFLTVFGHYLIFKNIEYLKKEKKKCWRKKIRWLNR